MTATHAAHRHDIEAAELGCYLRRRAKLPRPTYSGGGSIPGLPSFRKDVLNRLHRDRLVEYDTTARTLRLLPPGVTAAEELVASAPRRSATSAARRGRPRAAPTEHR